MEAPGNGRATNKAYTMQAFSWLDDGDQHLESAGGRRTSIGTMATHIGGAGTPTTTQQEPPAPTTDPLLQSLLISVRLFTQKAATAVGSANLKSGATIKTTSTPGSSTPTPTRTTNEDTKRRHR